MCCQHNTDIRFSPAQSHLAPTDSRRNLSCQLDTHVSIHGVKGDDKREKEKRSKSPKPKSKPVLEKSAPSLASVAACPKGRSISKSSNNSLPTYNVKESRTASNGDGKSENQNRSGSKSKPRSKPAPVVEEVKPSTAAIVTSQEVMPRQQQMMENKPMIVSIWKAARPMPLN